MACCAAIAIVIAALRTAWAWVTGRGPVDDGFPPAASWVVGRQPAGPGREPLAPASGAAVGPALAGTVLIYALLIHVLGAVGLADVEPPGGSGWLVRDTVLAAAVLGMLALRRRTSLAVMLVGVGALWFTLGAVDMHVLGAFEFRAAPLALDAAFHLSGWWLMAAAAGVAVVQRRPATASLGNAA